MCGGGGEWAGQSQEKAPARTPGLLGSDRGSRQAAGAGPAPAPVDVSGEEAEIQALEPAQNRRRHAGPLRGMRIDQTLLRPPSHGSGWTWRK